MARQKEFISSPNSTSAQALIDSPMQSVLATPSGVKLVEA